jgi:hypothetical protein
MHSTDNLEDGYMGSGKRLWHSIRKHGKENFKVEILEHYFTRQDLAAREKELVNEECLKDPMCMNLTWGGEGGGGWSLKSIDYLSRNRRIAKIRDYHSLEYRERLKAATIAGIAKSNTIHKWHTFDGMLGKSHSIETRQKMSLAHTGANNSQFGTRWVWIHKETESKRIPVDQKDTWILQDWVLGAKPKKVKLKKAKPIREIVTKNCKACNSLFELSNRDIKRNRRYCSVKCCNK